MSQYPPNPPGNLPPGMVPPYAPYGGGTFPPPQQKTSGAAITSLVLGILLCIPIITGLGAILFGIIGINSTRKPGVGGRGMAIAGLILGLLGIVGWIGMGGLLGVAWVHTKADRAVTSSFVTDLSTGNVSAAQALCAPSVTPTQVQAAATQVQGYGTLNSYTNTSVNSSSMNGSTTAIIGGVGAFSSGTHMVITTLSHPAGGTPLIESWQIR